MTGIGLKTVTPVVFDDPVYCRTYTGKCDHFKEFNMIRCSDENYKCSLFKASILKRSIPIYYVEKCQECKDHYQKARKDLDNRWFKMEYNGKTGKTERVFYEEGDPE